MHFIQPQNHSRRAFLRRAGQLAFTGAALPTAINLAAMGEAAAFNAGNDYKALVCIFLYAIKGIYFLALEYLLFLGLVLYGLNYWKGQLRND